MAEETKEELQEQPAVAEVADENNEANGANRPDGADRADEFIGYDRQEKLLRDEIERRKPESDADREKRERRERSKKIVAAFSNGMSALGNLWFTSQYAPNMYQHEKASQLAPLQRHYDKLKAEREANADKYLQFSLKLGDVENQRAATVREIEAQREKLRLANEAAKREADNYEWEKTLRPEKEAKEKAEREKAEREAVTAKAIADNAATLQGLKNKTEEAHASSYRASAAASAAGTVYGTFDGRMYTNQRDYEKAVYKAAREYNQRKGSDVVPVEWQEATEYGEKPHLYGAQDVAAQLEPLLAAERKAAQGKPAGKKKTGVNW